MTDLLPGWFCAQCKAFNGVVKESLTKCRCCSIPRRGSAFAMPNYGFGGNLAHLYNKILIDSPDKAARVSIILQLYYA